MLTGRAIKVSELVALGAVHRLASSPEEANQMADEYIKMLVGNAPGAIDLTKQLVQTAYGENDAAHNQAANNAFLHFAQPSQEAKYGIEMFRQKKQPDWNTLWQNAKL